MGNVASIAVDGGRFLADELDGVMEGEEGGYDERLELGREGGEGEEDGGHG